MKVTIDRQECIICGVCWSDCPDFFEQSPLDEFSQVVESRRVGGDPALGEAPAELADCVRQAAEGCPVEIIHVDEA